MLKNFILCFIIIFGCGPACSSLKKKPASEDKISISAKDKKLNQVLIFTDLSGKFSMKRSMKVVKDKVLFQRIVYQDDFSKFLERARSVSQLKLDEDQKVQVFRPLVSQFRGWFEGVEYSSQIKISYQKKKVEILVNAKDKKYPTKQEFSLPPEAKDMCFMNMIPECIKFWGLHHAFNPSAKGKSQWFYVIMDSYPFLDLLYTDVPNKWITEATLTYDGMQDKEHLLSLEIHDQVISLKFDESWNFVALYWVSQGVTLVAN